MGKHEKQLQTVEMTDNLTEKAACEKSIMQKVRAEIPYRETPPLYVTNGSVHCGSMNLGSFWYV
jgi:hypothetical protein